MGRLNRKALQQCVKRPVAWLKNRRYERGVQPNIVMSFAQTIAVVQSRQGSIARFGDGELNLAIGRGIRCQQASPALQQRLCQLLRTPPAGLAVCLPDVFAKLDYLAPSQTLSLATGRDFWRQYMTKSGRRRQFSELLASDHCYGNAFISRCYLEWQDKKGAGERFAALRRLWQDRDIIFVEGPGSRLGVNNDLFNNARSIARIIGPSRHAFASLTELYQQCMAQPDDRLYILALGPTATVLAADLAAQGRQALDLGHIDVEYEWYLMGAHNKQAIAGKHVHETGDEFHSEQPLPASYHAQIIYSAANIEQ